MRTLLRVVLWAAVPSIPRRRLSSAEAMEGAWKVVEIVVTGANPDEHTQSTPSLFIFGQKHYSMM
jgi:hypothetical protein